MDCRTGMTAFIGPKDWPELPCVLKRLYSDFIVIEIPKFGKALQVNMEECSESTCSDSQTSLKRPLADDGDGIKAEDNTPEAKRIKNDDAENITSDTSNPVLFTSEDLQKIDDICNGSAESHTMDVKSFSKDERRAGYDFLRSKYGKQLVTNSENGKLEIRRWLKNGTVIDSRRNRVNRIALDHFPKDHHLFFTMTKVNKDTNYALSILAKLSGLKLSHLCVAGTKDRRAITTQLVCSVNTPMSRIRRIAPKLREIYVDNFHYAPRKLQLGNLWGNHFEIVLRNMDISAAGGKDGLASRIQHWSSNGFLNYFGAQRFGTCGVNTAEVGRFILAGHWKEAAHAILAPRDGPNNQLGQCLREYHTSGDAERALKVLRRNSQRFNARRVFESIEVDLLTLLSKNGSNFKDAVFKLPRDTRSLYIHAYQSLVFNKILSRRVEKFGTAYIAGDLNVKGEVVDDTNVLSVEEIHLPLPSINENYPRNQVGEWYKEIATADEISKESFGNLEKNFVIGDVFRPIVVKPSDVEWELLIYTDDRAILQKSPFIKNVTQNAHEDKIEAVDVKNEMNNDMTKDEDVAYECNLESKENNDGELCTKSEDSKVIEEKGVSKKTAIRIKFNLPACSYATVALRELLRTDFSKEAQKEKEGVSPKDLDSKDS